LVFFEVLARIYFSITGYSREEIREVGKTFPSPHTGNESKDF
jgi:hypothetical protein